MDPEILGHLAQLFVPRPEECRRADQNRCDQVRVGHTDPEAVQAAGLDQHANFVEVRHLYLRQKIQQREHSAAITEVAERKLRDNERVDRNLTAHQLIA